MKKPIIAVTPLYDSEKESYWMIPGYMKGVEKAGGVPIMLPLTSDTKTLDILAGQYDGFLFTGGQDISPHLYGEDKSYACGEVCVQRDAMEQCLLEKVIRLDKPILGICRGIQLLNVVFGGTLYQDLSTEYPSEIQHHQTPPYDIPIHKVDVHVDSPLYTLLQRKVLEVNSYHHQAIKNLSSRLQPMAYASDGLIEAVCIPDARFVWAVQWHPEFSYKKDQCSLELFRKFVKEAGTLSG